MDAELTEVLSILTGTFESGDVPEAGVNEVAEEMRLVQQWIRRVRDRHPIVDVDPGSLSDAAATIVTALRDSESAAVRY
jgi:hypothetical protein